jgi:hypothetical protein
MMNEAQAIRSLTCLSAELDVLAKMLQHDWGDADPPYTILFGQIGHALAIAASRMKDDEKERVFSAIELIMTEGTRQTRDAVATGLLEALQADASAGFLDFREVAPFLGDKSIEYCRAWDEFTGCRTPGLDGPR